MRSQHLVVFAKRPLAGYAKTRLGDDLGDEPAAGVYARLLYAYLGDLVRADFPNTAIELAVAEAEDAPYFEDAFPEFIVRPQISGDLGARLAHSFELAFAEGATSVIITGSDIPDLTASIVHRAFDALRMPTDSGALPGVIGPAVDGGYYLIGMQAPGADLFTDITWSTAQVLTETLARAARFNVHLVQISALMDIDTLADYEDWRATLRSRRQQATLTEDGKTTMISNVNSVKDTVSKSKRRSATRFDEDIGVVGG